MTSPENDEDKFLSPILTSRSVASPRFQTAHPQHSSTSTVRDLVALLRQRIEELSKKLKEEQDMISQVMKNAQDVLKSTKYLREVIAALVEEKDGLEENLKQLMRPTTEVPFLQHLHKLQTDYETLKKDNDELRKTEEKLEQEAKEREALKNAFSVGAAGAPAGVGATGAGAGVPAPKKSVEVIAKQEENEKLRRQIERERYELENQSQRAEAQRLQLLDATVQVPEQEANDVFYISAQDARMLALKIKKMQKELSDLGMKQHELKIKHVQCDNELDKIKSQEPPPAVPPQEDIEEIKTQKEDEDREKREYNSLVDALFLLQTQIRGMMASQEPEISIVETIKKYIETLAMETRIEQNNYLQKLAQEENDKKAKRSPPGAPPKKSNKSVAKITKRKTGHKKKDKKAKETPADEE